MRNSNLTLALTVAFGLTVVASNDAFAVSQWTRKYKTSCTTCHTMFPRLNYYGEKFKMNGYQDMTVAEPDGSTSGKKSYGNTDIGRLEDYFGVRLNVVPIQYDTKSVAKSPTSNPAREPKFTFGQTAWLQFFTAGTIVKNVSVFDELEVGPTSATAVGVKHGWFTLGFHNLVGARGLVNVRVGRISPKDWTSFSNRLRIYPDITAFPDKVVPSGGAASADRQEAIGTSDSTNGIDYYGTNGLLLWAMGFGNPNYTNSNQYLNYWGSLRANIDSEESAFEGSSVSFHYYKGVDTKAASASAVQLVNHYWRMEPAINVRYGQSEFVASYIKGKDLNYTLAATARERSFEGFTTIAVYQLTDWFRPGVQFDRIWQDREDQRDTPFTKHELEKARFAVNLGFRPTDVIQAFAAADYDVLPKLDTARNHKYTLTLRTMF
ncbi:MAG: hypothetical protein NDJ90_14385 [Oligoflexia bacterium]|nr:hypothetical protein [Oligoflexia bacterium]